MYADSSLLCMYKEALFRAILEPILFVNSSNLEKEICDILPVFDVIIDYLVSSCDWKLIIKT